MSNTTNAAEELRQEIIRLGPWHHDVAVTPEVSTRAYLDALPGTYEEGGPKDPNRVSLVDDHDPWLEMLDLLYPGDAGLDGRSFLECACNCGAYSFFSKEAGAGKPSASTCATTG
jgi:hypothetical protein